MQFHWKQSHQQNAWSAKLDEELNFFKFSNVMLLLGTYQKECDSQWKCRQKGIRVSGMCTIISCSSWRSKKIDSKLHFDCGHKILVMSNINLKLTVICRNRHNVHWCQHHISRQPIYPQLRPTIKLTFKLFLECHNLG